MEFGVVEGVRPVIKIVDPNALLRMNERRVGPGAREGQHLKGFIVGDASVQTLAAQG